jgi:hypothetical protein
MRVGLLDMSVKLSKLESSYGQHGGRHTLSAFDGVFDDAGFEGDDGERLLTTKAGEEKPWHTRKRRQMH